jgi:hypothetical protein
MSPNQEILGQARGVNSLTAFAAMTKSFNTTVCTVNYLSLICNIQAITQAITLLMERVFGPQYLLFLFLPGGEA